MINQLIKRTLFWLELWMRTKLWNLLVANFILLFNVFIVIIPPNCNYFGSFALATKLLLSIESLSSWWQGSLQCYCFCPARVTQPAFLWQQGQTRHEGFVCFPNGDKEKQGLKNKILVLLLLTNYFDWTDCGFVLFCFFQFTFSCVYVAIDSRNFTDTSVDSSNFRQGDLVQTIRHISLLLTQAQTHRWRCWDCSIKKWCNCWLLTP